MLRKVFLFIFILISCRVYSAEVVGLSCDYLSNPLGIDRTEPALGWKLKGFKSGDRQSGYRILVASSLEKLNDDKGDIWDSGKVKSQQQINVCYKGRNLLPGQMVYWKVKVWTRKEGALAWSAPAFFSVAVDRWPADFISLDHGPEGADPVFWKRFQAERNGRRYLLHVNSLGYHDVYINNRKVGDAVLQPAVSQSDVRSLICCYDVTEFISDGSNDLVVWISDGWNRAYAENRLCSVPAVRCLLQVVNADGMPENVLSTDGGWYGRPSGYRMSGSWKPFEFGGEVVDAAMLLSDFSSSSLEKASWTPVKIPSVKPHLATGQMVEPVRYQDSIHPVSAIKISDGNYLLDFGTCVTAMLEVVFPDLRKGAEVTFDYADALDKNSQFPLSRRGDFKDVYISSGQSPERFVNHFNYHGFRYVMVSGLETAPSSAMVSADDLCKAVTAHPISTDYEDASSFCCSDPDLNAIHDMVKRTVKCLTPGGYMIDCPHIERLGYGGDGHASTPTLQTMYDVAPLIYNWTTAWADAQRPDGGMPHTAPAPYGAGGGPYWCAFLIAASWESYVRYADIRPARAYYPQMKRWMEFADRFCDGGLLHKWSDDPIRRGWFLGDWAAPEYIDRTDSMSVALVANCVLAQSFELMSRIALLNDDVPMSHYYSDRHSALLSAIHSHMYVDGRYATGSQIDMCYPMLVGATPESLVPDVVARLKDVTSTLYDSHLSVGLVGVPVVTQWATASRESDWMYDMLKQRSYPGYLYMLDQGATTTWEYWNGNRSHIHNCFNGIGSWFYEAVAGILPDPEHPGYSHFTVQPQLPCGLTWAEAVKQTPYGEIRSRWEISGDEFCLDISVPFGTSATVFMPDGSAPLHLSCGFSHLSVPVPAVSVPSGTEESWQDFVDTRVGTDANSLNKDGRFGAGTEVFGQIIPAVIEPHGMNFWTAQTRDTEKKGVAPYYYCDSLFQGFRSSHWMVGSCTQDYGSATLFPATSVDKLTPADRAVAFDHEDEVAMPSYYSVFLKGSGIRAELTGKSRSAVFRFTYPDGDPAYLIVNPNSDEGRGFVELDTLKREIRVCNPIHRIYQGWGQPTGSCGYFILSYEDEIEDFGTYRDGKGAAGEIRSDSAAGIGIYVKFKRSGKPVVVRAASSFTGFEGARLNMESEIPEFDFDGTRSDLSAIWEKHLGKLRVSSDDHILCRKFYGSLYRTSFLPRTINDVDGSYPKFSSGTPVLKTNYDHYDDFSMWDTYRALHPLLVLLEPERDGVMMQSLVDKYVEGGWLPVFPCWNSYTAAMIGDHCTAAIGDAIVKGVDNFDVATAYEGMRKNAFEVPQDYHEYVDGKGRRALKSYLEYGYIPLEDQVREAFHTCEQSSRTLEYAYDDFVLAQVAQKLGHTGDYLELMRRCRNYRNVIDPATGYVSGRHDDGRFLDSVDVDNYARFVTEGAPCHYSWYVPQDPLGLMEVMGGRDAYLCRLDRLFEEKLYWHGNEPCHQIAYMYDYAGQAWKTQKYIREILDNEYGDLPGGLAGNDDAGQMSAWFIFSSLGFYPVCPGKPEYMIGCPQFDKAELQLSDGKSFTILTEKTGRDNRYIQSATLNGIPYSRSVLSHEDIVNGGEMVFVLGDEPRKDWGAYK